MNKTPGYQTDIIGLCYSWFYSQLSIFTVNKVFYHV